MLGINITSTALLYFLADVLTRKGFEEILMIRTGSPNCAVAINLADRLFSKTTYNKDFYNWTCSDVEALVLIPEWAIEPYLNPNYLEDSKLELPRIKSWSVRERIMKDFRG